MRSVASRFVVIPWLLACGEASTGEGDGTTTGASTTGASTIGDPTTETGSSSSTSATSVDADTTSTGGPQCPEETEPVPPGPALPNAKACSLAVIDPAVDPATAIDAGDGVGQIPTVIADVLLRNCGCHYNENMLTPPDYVDYISDNQPMRTWADFQGMYGGTFPTMHEDLPAYVAIERRVSCADPLPMPPLGCRVEGEDGTITQADLDLLAVWLAEGAPDGASYAGG